MKGVKDDAEGECTKPVAERKIVELKMSKYFLIYGRYVGTVGTDKYLVQ